MSKQISSKERQKGKYSSNGYSRYCRNCLIFQNLHLDKGKRKRSNNNPHHPHDFTMSWHHSATKPQKTQKSRTPRHSPYCDSGHIPSTTSSTGAGASAGRSVRRSRTTVRTAAHFHTSFTRPCDLFWTSSISELQLKDCLHMMLPEQEH